MKYLSIIPKATSLLIALVFMGSGVYSVLAYEPPAPPKPVVKAAKVKPVPPPPVAVEPPHVAEDDGDTVTDAREYTQPVAYTPPPAPTLYDYANQLGLVIGNGLTLVLTTDLPPGDDVAAGHTAIGVYYSATKTIYVSGSLDAWSTRHVLAYEYMHYYWYSVADAGSKAAMASEGEALQTWHPTMQANMGTLAPIHADEASDERTAVMCTRIPMRDLSAFANGYCNNAIPNRGLVM